MKWLLFMLVVVASGQTFPTRHFKNGEVLRVDGADVTIRVPEARCGGSDAAPKWCPDKVGFFQVHLTRWDSKGNHPNSDYVEIQVGREEETLALTPNLPKNILRFEIYTSPIQAGVDTAVGSIFELDRIRTIRVRLLKVSTEEIFR
jgi:hypothetical protein